MLLRRELAEPDRFSVTNSSLLPIRTTLWKKPSTKDEWRSIALTITPEHDGLGAKIRALSHREGTLLAITTAELKKR